MIESVIGIQSGADVPVGHGNEIVRLYHSRVYTLKPFLSPFPMWIIEKIVVYTHADNTYKYMKGKRAEQSTVLYSSRAVVLPFAVPHPRESLMLQITIFSEIF